jgi:ankyrin repeat protein
LNTKNYFGKNVFDNLKKEINFPKSHEQQKKCLSLLNFFKEEKKKNEQEHTKSVSEKKDAVWKEEPMVKAIKKNNLKWFCLLIVLGGKLEADDFKYLVNKIENESGKIVGKRYLINFLSKIRDQYDQTLFHHAAKIGKLKCLEILIGCKLNVNERKTDEEQTSCLFIFKNGETKFAKTLFKINVYNVQRKTPLHFAADQGHHECLELLIRKGGDVNAKDEDDCIPLHFAAVFGKVDCLEVLLANGADVNARTCKQDTPLHIITLSSKQRKAEQERCTEMLISAGADINAKDENDWTPLHFAASNSKAECLEVLLANGADVNARNNKQDTPLHIIGDSPQGSNAEKERCAAMLITAGADVNAKNAKDWTPLHWAAWFVKVDYLELLLANEADANARTINQITPLQIIAVSSKGSKAEKERCFEMLINAGADVDAKGVDGRTPLHYAASYGNIHCLEVLLANGADVNARNNEQCKPLHIIVNSPKGSKAEKKRCVEMLINAGAEVDAKEQNGCTTLHVAALTGKVECLEILLANGADVNARGIRQNTPLHMIGLSPEGSKAEKERWAEILINAGADVDAKDEYGNTIFAYPFFQTLREERPALFTQN